MATRVLQQRIAMLDSLVGCPACGAKPRLRYGGHKSRRVIFECEASFVCDSNTEITAMMPCPAPSDTAALMLNMEIVEETARSVQAGAA